MEFSKLNHILQNLSPWKYIRFLACPRPTPKTLSLISDFSILEFPLTSVNPGAFMLGLSIHLLNLFFSLSIILTLICSEINSCSPSALAPEVLLPRALPRSSSENMGLKILFVIYCSALFPSFVGTAYSYFWSAECSGENSWTPRIQLS